MATVIDIPLHKPARDVDGQNHDRASWALAAVAAFRDACRGDEEDAVADLICDLLHLAEQEAKIYGTPNDVLRRGVGHFMAETGRAPW